MYTNNRNYIMNKSVTQVIKLTSEENEMFSVFAHAKGLTFAEFCKSAIIEKIEDLLDTKIANQSYQEYLNDTDTISLKMLKSQLEI